MQDPPFLTARLLDAIHDEVLTAYGGAAGVLKPDALSSALASARAGWGETYFNAFPFEMAAAYLVGIALGHPYLDGNKRVAAASAAVFLEAAGYPLEAKPGELRDLVLAVCAHQLDKADVAAWFAAHQRPPA